jgi:hypothetical protein
VSSDERPGIHQAAQRRKEALEMLMLIIGVILLVIAIAGGVIIHPILFALGIVAIFLFVSGRRTAF